MSVLTTIRLALRAMTRNLVRSLLTMLGIVFGIGAVIAMVAFGQGAQAAVKDVFASLGTNTLILSNAQARGAQGPSAGGAGGASLTWDDITAIATEVSTVSAAVPVLDSRGTQVVSESANWNTGITGTTADWFKVRDWGAG